MVAPLAAAAAIQAGSSVLGGLMGRRAARRARADQERAFNEANTQLLANRDRTFEEENPWRETGLGALRQMGSFDTSPLDSRDVYNDPGYQFAREEGLRGIEGSAAAGTGLYRGSVLKRLADFNQGLATRFYDNAFQRQMQDRGQRFGMLNTTAGYGERSQGRRNQAGSEYAQTFANLRTGLGNQQAGNQMYRGQMGMQMLQGLGQAAGSYFGGAGGGGPGFAAYDPNGMGIGQFGPGADVAPYLRRKDGGRVTMEMVRDGDRMIPKVGTKVRKQGGTGGGLSREEVLARLEAASAPTPTPNDGIGSLPGNPLTNPKRIIDDREKKAGIGYKGGGKIRGPGGTRGDKIPALLSDQEHVIDAKTVKMLGKGSYKKGHSALDSLRKMAR